MSGPRCWPCRLATTVSGGGSRRAAGAGWAGKRSVHLCAVPRPCPPPQPPPPTPIPPPTPNPHPPTRPPTHAAFKLVIVDQAGYTHWELGANRHLHVPEACTELAGLSAAPLLKVVLSWGETGSTRLQPSDIGADRLQVRGAREGWGGARRPPAQGPICGAAARCSPAHPCPPHTRRQRRPPSPRWLACCTKRLRTRRTGAWGQLLRGAWPCSG